MQDEALSSITLDGVLAKVFAELDTLNATPPSVEWGEKAVQTLRFVQGVETGFGHAKAYTLAIIKEHWEDLPFEFRKEHGFSFMTFAKLYTGKQRSTIDNYIHTAKVWFIDKVKPMGRVKVIEREKDGKPIKEGGAFKSRDVEFCPYQIDMSKLLQVNSRATKGTMTERLWEMLVDDFYSCDDVALEHMGRTSGGEDFQLRFLIEGPGLYAQLGPDIICISEELAWDQWESGGLGREAINKLMMLLGVTLDEDQIYSITHAGYAVEQENGKS